MNTQSDAARPHGWLVRKGDSDTWAYCDNEEDADFYGKQSGLSYEKIALYTADDYDALRDEVERLREALSAIEKLGCDARTPIRNNVKMRGIARAALSYQG